MASTCTAIAQPIPKAISLQPCQMPFLSSVVCLRLLYKDTMRKLSVLFLFLIASIRAEASSSGPAWLEVRSPHFTVVTDASEKDARRVTTQFERMRAVFHTLLPAASDDAAAPIVVLALKDKKSFRSLEPEAYLAKNQLDLAGYFLRTQNKNYILLRLDAEGDHPFATVYHEYTHYMLRKADDWIPLWLDEGLAEFYQNTQIQDKEVRVGQASPDDIFYLRQNRLLPLTTLLTVDHNSPYYHDEQKGSIFYAESWALTHYLETTDFENKANRIQDYSRLLIQHEDPLTAAQHAFGDLKKLEQALNAYVQKPTFGEFRLIAPVVFQESSFQVRPLPTPEADAIRAGVLLGVERTQEAEALLQSVLQADPNNALAHETMGSLKFQQRDIPAAKKWYGEAVQLDSQSYLALYYFAVMSLQADDRDHDDTIEHSLQKSIQLNPSFAPSFDALAEFYASRHEKLPEAHMLNLKAIGLEPENLSYRLNAAGVLTEDQKFDDALRVLKSAERVAKSPSDTDRIQHRIAEIEGYQAAVAQTQQQSNQTASPAEVVTTTVTNGGRTITLHTANDDPGYPAGAPTGPHHTVSGVIHGVKCLYPTILTLVLDRSGSSLSLYTNNYFKVPFTTANYEPKGDLLPCTAIDGMKASIEYGEVTDKRMAGQILSIELSK